MSDVSHVMVKAEELEASQLNEIQRLNYVITAIANRRLGLQVASGSQGSSQVRQCK